MTIKAGDESTHREVIHERREAGRRGLPFWVSGVLGLLVCSFLITPRCALAQPAEEAALGKQTRALVIEWRPLLQSMQAGEVPRAMARDAANKITALADERGVSVAWGERRDRAVLEGVRDLVIGPDHALWIATQVGLFRWEKGARPLRRDLRGGEAANRVSAIAASSHGILVATAAGAQWSTTGRTFQRLSLPGASAAVLDVAIANPSNAATARGVAANQVSIWLTQAGRLTEIYGIATDAGLRISSRRDFGLPRPAGEREPVDLYFSTARNRLIMLFEDVIAWRDSSAGSTLVRRDPWIVDRPTLPPGARIARMIETKSEIWLATDRGVLWGEGLGGAFRRASAPVGTTTCSDIGISATAGSRGADVLVALCTRGLYLGERRSSGRDRVVAEVFGKSHSGSRPRARRLEKDPPLSQIRARALRRAGLGVEPADRLRKGLWRRAFWPELAIRVGADLDRDEDWDSDQSYVSGGQRHLVDRTHQRSEGLSAAIELDWDLGALVYPDDAVNLSRELRQVISLRDDVSDEINQLYVERQGIRARLQSLEMISAEERARLELRALEIAAGLDAWTGGWLSTWVAAEQGGSAESK